MNAIQSLGSKICSSLIEKRARNPSGKLTRWNTGRRFLYMEVPAKPLPRNLCVSIFTASIYHKEQTVPTCNCLAKGHHSSTCEAPTKCKQCFTDHHKAVDKVCPQTPKRTPRPTPDQAPPPHPPKANPSTIPHPSAAHLSPDKKKQQSKALSLSKVSSRAVAHKHDASKAVA